MRNTSKGGRELLSQGLVGHPDADRQTDRMVMANQPDVGGWRIGAEEDRCG